MFHLTGKPPPSPIIQAQGIPYVPNMEVGKLVLRLGGVQHRQTNYDQTADVLSWKRIPKVCRMVFPCITIILTSF